MTDPGPSGVVATPHRGKLETPRTRRRIDAVAANAPKRALALLVAGLIAVGAAAGLRPASAQVRSGGTFKIAFAVSDLDSLDPSLSDSAQGWALLDTTCARLMSHPDSAAGGVRVVPEVAARNPAASRDGRTWTFRLRTGFRFSDGTPVRASAFARAISRTLDPRMKSRFAQYLRDIVGAHAFHVGKATSVAGVTARGNTLIVRFNHPTPDFLARTTMPSLCAVPPGLPINPEGEGAFASAGPYYVSEYRPGERVVIVRNRFYGGHRSHHVDGFVVDLQAISHADVLDRVERGEADWGTARPPDYADPHRRLVAKYGMNRTHGRFFVKPGLELRTFALNSSRPLFRDNPQLRRAVNFALDRRAIQRVAGGEISSTLTDQYLPPSLPGYDEASIYPLSGPDLKKARSLARGHTRGGTALLYTLDAPAPVAIAQIVKQNLKRIGINVVLNKVPVSAYDVRVPRVPYDIAFTPWTADYPDPYATINLLLDGTFAGGGSNWARFDSPKYNRLLREAALLRGEARYRAYGELDVQLARDAAPLLPIDYVNEQTLVSKRVGCVILRPTLDLTTVCLK